MQFMRRRDHRETIGLSGQGLRNLTTNLELNPESTNNKKLRTVEAIAIRLISIGNKKLLIWSKECY